MWKDMYRINVPIIDQQHQELFHRVSRFISALRSGGHNADKTGIVEDTLMFMAEYVVSHFHAEETWMREINYPDYIAHEAIHRSFVQEMQEFTERLRACGYDDAILQPFAGRLLAWLIYHVASEDQKIGAYSNGGRTCENEA